MKKTRKCIICNKEFILRDNQHMICSLNCRNIYMSKIGKERGFGKWMKGRRLPWMNGKYNRKSHYGINNPMYGKHHSEETKQKLREIRAKVICPTKDTSIEIKIQNFLKQLEIEFFTHQNINNIKHRYQCDIFIPSMNLIIECDGKYWHSYPTGTEIDHIRTKELIEKGFKVLRLWEVEIQKMDLITFQNILNHRRLNK